MLRNIGGTRRSLGALVGVAGLAMTMAACGGGSSGGSTGGSGSGANAALTIVGAKGTTIQADFNPFHVATYAATEGASMLFLPLETYNSLNGKYTPLLAAAHENVSPTRIDVTLRDGVTWSNGNPVTADDVLFTYSLLKKFPALDTTGVWHTVSDVSAEGNKLVFTLKTTNSQAGPDILQVPIVPKSEWSKVADPVTYPNAAAGVVSGPYKLGSFSPTKVTYAKNPAYFAAADMTTAPATVVGTPQAPGATQVLNLSRGTYDWNSVNDNSRGGLQKDWVDKNPEHNRYWLPPYGLVTMYLNLTKAPFDDQVFRQALSDSIDRQAVADRANINGYHKPATQTGLLPAAEDLIPTSVPNGGKPTYDVAKAKQALQAAGYRYAGDQLIGKDGKPVTFELQTVQGFVDWIGEAQEVAAQLEKLGVTVKVTQAQFSAAVSNIYGGRFDAAIYFSAQASTPYGNFRNLLSSSLSAPIGKAASGNYGRLKAPQVDQLLDEVASSTDTKTQNTALGALASYVYDSVPVVELTVSPSWFEYTTKKFTGWPDASNPYANPASQFAYLNVVPNLKSGG